MKNQKLIKLRTKHTMCPSVLAAAPVFQQLVALSGLQQWQIPWQPSRCLPCCYFVCMCVCVCVLGISCSIHGLWCEIRECSVLWRSTETHWFSVETSTWPVNETTSAHHISLSLFCSLTPNYFKLLYIQHQCTSGEAPFYCMFLKFQIIGNMKVYRIYKPANQSGD